MNHSSRILLSFLTILFILSGCGSTTSNPQINFSESESSYDTTDTSDSPPIRIAISSVLSPTETVKNYREIASYIGKQLNKQAIIIQRRSYHEINNLMMNDGADIALYPTGAYINYGLHDNLEGIAAQERQGSSYYYGYLITKDGKNLENLEDLKGGDIAFYDPTSFSGYTFIKEMLKEQDETPDSFFSSHLFTYSHEDSIDAVRNNVVDAAAVNSLSYESMNQSDKRIVQDLKIITQSEAMGTGPVIVRSDLPEAEKKTIKESFLTMAEDPFMSEVLEGLYIDRFIPFDPELYQLSGDAYD